MSNRFLITNTLMFIQDHYAEQLFQKSGEITVNGQSARIIETNNCDQYSQIGVSGSNESFLFDLNGMFYAVPESWAKPKVLNIAQGGKYKDFTLVFAENVNDLVLTATAEQRPQCI